MYQALQHLCSFIPCNTWDTFISIVLLAWFLLLLFLNSLSICVSGVVCVLFRNLSLLSWYPSWLFNPTYLSFLLSFRILLLAVPFLAIYSCSDIPGDFSSWFALSCWKLNSKMLYLTMPARTIGEQHLRNTGNDL